jgi:acyl carrier protein
LDLLMMLEDELDISIPINILLDVRTPEQLLNALLPRLEATNGPV